MIDVLQNLKDWANAEGKSMHDASEVVKRLSGLTEKPLAKEVHVVSGDLNILLAIDTQNRQRLVADGVIPKPEFAYYGRWSVQQVREIIANGIEDKAA